MRRLALGLLLALAACAEPPSLPRSPVAAGPDIAVRAQPVPLDESDPGRDRIGRFAWAGGVWLTSSDTSRLHGLSDIKVDPKGALIAESDEGDLLRARVTLGPDGKLTGLAGARMTALTGEDGKPLQTKAEADSEGIALFPNGDLLVSFEEHDRILLYPARGGPPHAVPSPDVKFPFNLGMEALALAPDVGPDAYVTGGEASGQTWICRLSSGCVADRVVPKPPEYGLVAVAPLPGRRVAWLIRAWDPVRGNRVSLLIQDAAGTQIDRLDLAKPLSIDNYEGLAAAPRPDGSIRFYLISDDNFSPNQRTLLIAFDWR